MFVKVLYKKDRSEALYECDKTFRRPVPPNCVELTLEYLGGGRLRERELLVDSSMAVFFMNNDGKTIDSLQLEPV